MFMMMPAGTFTAVAHPFVIQYLAQPAQGQVPFAFPDGFQGIHEIIQELVLFHGYIKGGQELPHGLFPVLGGKPVGVSPDIVHIIVDLGAGVFRSDLLPRLIIRVGERILHISVIYGFREPCEALYLFEAFAEAFHIGGFMGLCDFFPGLPGVVDGPFEKLQKPVHGVPEFFRRYGVVHIRPPQLRNQIIIIPYDPVVPRYIFKIHALAEYQRQKPQVLINLVGGLQHILQKLKLGRKSIQRLRDLIVGHLRGVHAGDPLDFFGFFPEIPGPFHGSLGIQGYLLHPEQLFDIGRGVVLRKPHERPLQIIIKFQLGHLEGKNGKKPAFHVVLPIVGLHGMKEVCAVVVNAGIIRLHPHEVGRAPDPS